MNLLLDLLFPPRCAFCGALMDRPGEGVCPDCVLPLVPPEKVLRGSGGRARHKYPGIAKNRRMETAFLGKI